MAMHSKLVSPRAAHMYSCKPAVLVHRGALNQCGPANSSAFCRIGSLFATTQTQSVAAVCQSARRRHATCATKTPAHMQVKLFQCLGLVNELRQLAQVNVRVIAALAPANSSC